MKNIFAKALGVAAVAAMTMTSCGDSFLDTDIYDAVDMEGALDNANRVELALNGTYYRFSQYYFAGNYATVTPDIASDITYWNGSNSHQNAMYQFNYLDTEYSMLYIWPTATKWSITLPASYRPATSRYRRQARRTRLPSYAPRLRLTR